jgi:hypothetical protein
MYGWKPVWDHDPSPATAELLFVWFNHKAYDPAIRRLTQEFLNSGDAQAIGMLRDWANSHQGSVAANAILSVFKKNGSMP